MTDETVPLSDSGNDFVRKVVVSEASRHVDIIHTSLAGMTAIVLMLLAAVALPVFKFAPVTQISAFLIMAFASLSGIGGLYYINYRVHQHVSNQARLTEVLVNSLGQGFMSFNMQGICGQVYSQACLELLETAPAGKRIVDVLRLPPDQRDDFKDWIDILFMPNHALGFDDVVKFLPQFFPHSQGRHVRLEYKPIYDAENVLTHMIVIATDRTEEHDAQERAQQQQNFADMISRIFKERNQFLATITQIRKFIEDASRPVTRAEGAPLLRMLHTLKAAVKYFHLDHLGDIVKGMESDLRSKSVETDEDYQTILLTGRTAMEENLNAVLEQVRDLIGQDYEGKGNTIEIEESVLYDFAQQMASHNVDQHLIHRYLSTIAAIPVNDCFRLFERELGDIAQITGKQVKPVRYTGSNPRVLTMPLQDLMLSLTHICRNIIDHGIEPSVTRLARGKDPSGQISIHTDVTIDEENKKEWLRIVISDDGNGIDPSRIRTKLASIDPHGSWRDEDDHTVIQHIFSFGFSTRDSVTDLSGHGVGMEAVEREVHLLGGSIKVTSEIYHGTRFDIRVPYVLDLQFKSRPVLEDVASAAANA